MGSKSVLAHTCAPIRPVPRLSRVRPRRWHPVVYLDRGPVRFAGHGTVTEAMREARKLAYALGARTWSAVPGRALIATGHPTDDLASIPVIFPGRPGHARRSALQTTVEGGAK